MFNLSGMRSAIRGKRLNDLDGKSLPRLAIEGSTIVLSILVAFGIEAAWEERKERVREREAIEQLISEFEVVRDRLVSLDSVYEHGPFRGKAPLRELLGLMGSERGAFSDARLDSLVASSLGGIEPELPDGALSAVVASGQLALIRSDSLRISLAEWMPHRETVQADAEGIGELTSDHLLPFLWSQASVRAVDVNTRYHVELGFGPFDRDHWPLLQSRMFENLINERLTILEAASGRLSEALDHAEVVLSLLRAELTEL